MRARWLGGIAALVVLATAEGAVADGPALPLPSAAVSLPAPPGTALPILGFGGLEVDDAHGQVFVAAKSGNVGIAVADLQGRPVNRLLPGVIPAGMALSPDRATLYVGTDTGIVAVDTASLRVTRTYPTPGRRPHAVAVTATRLWFAFSDFGRDQLASFDLAAPTPTVEDPPVDFAAGMDTLHSDPRDPRLFTASAGYSFSVFDGTTTQPVPVGGAIVGSAAELGNGPIGAVRLAPTGGEVYVVRTAPYDISAWSATGSAYLGSYAGGDFAEAVAANATNTLIAGAFGRNDGSGHDDLAVFARGVHDPIAAWTGLDRIPPGGLVYGAHDRLYAVTTGPYPSSDVTYLHVFAGSPLAEAAPVTSPALPRLTVDDTSVAENAGTATVSLDLDHPAQQPVTVDYLTVGAPDVCPADRTGVVTFPPGTTQQTIVLPIADNAVDDFARRCYVELVNAQHAALQDGTARVTVLDDDGPPRLSLQTSPVQEGDSGTRMATLTIRILPAPTTTTTVTFDAAPLTADSRDFAPQSGTLTFAPGEREKTVLVPVYGDTEHERDETFRATVWSADVVVEAGMNTDDVVIRDDDAAPMVPFP